MTLLTPLQESIANLIGWSLIHSLWLLSRRIRQEREHACDDLAILVTGNRLQYARALTAVAEKAAQNRLAVAANGGNLSIRIHRILRRGDVPKPRPSHVLTATVLGAILVSCIFALALPEDSTANTVTPVAQDVSGTGKSLEPISGKVLDSSGEPLAGATVYLRRRPFRSHDGPLELAQVETKADGVFAFHGVEVPDLFETHPTRVFPLDVIAMKPGCGIRWRRLTNAKTDIALQLKRQAPLTGVLKDDAGNPVADAKIRVQHVMSLNTITKINLAEGQTPSENGDSFLNISASTAEVSSTTDAQGRFELLGLPHRVGVVLTADDPRFVKSQWYAATTDEKLPQIRAGKIVYPPRPKTVGQIMQQRVYSELVPIHTSPVALPITRGVHLRYRVLNDATGEPVPLAKLAVQDSPPKEAVTDPNGFCDFYQFDPNSEFSLRVLAPEGSTFIDWQDTVALTANLSDDREIRLQEGAVVMGKVVDASTRLGVPDARVSFVPEKGYSKPTAPRLVTTDANGGFRFVVPESSGRVVLKWAPAGYIAMSQENDGPVVQPSLDDPITGLTLDVIRRPSIPFKFVTDKGTPLAVKATLRVYYTSNSYRETLEQIEESDVLDVSRLITGARSISAIQILVRSADDRLAAFLRTKDIASLQSDQAREIVLLPTATVHGRILNKETNEPISEAKTSISVSYTPRGGQNVNSYTCDDQGRYHFERLVPGMQYSIGANAENFSARNSIHNRFVAKAAGSHTLDISLVPDSPEPIVNLAPLKVASIEGLSPQKAYDTLVREYDKAYKAYQDLLEKHRSDEAHSHADELTDRIVALREPTPAYAQAMMALADEHRGSNIELKALKWVCKARLIAGTESRHRPLRIEAAARLLKQYHDSAELADVVSNIIYNSPDRYNAAEKLMKSPDHEVQGRACLVAADMLSQRHLDPHRGGHAELRDQAIELYERVINKYADITHWNRKSIASEAKDRLFELRDLQLGALAPEIEGVDLDGKPMKLSDFRGQVVVIHYWESGIGDFGRLKQIADEYKGRPLVVVGVNTDKNAAEAKSQAVEFGLKIRHWHDPKRNIHARWSGSWPDIHVIGHDGKLLYRGQRKSPQPLEDVLDKAVAAAE